MSNEIIEDMLGLRKELGRKSLKAFAKTYFSDYCKLAFAPFQVELLADLEYAVLDDVQIIM